MSRHEARLATEADILSTAYTDSQREDCKTLLALMSEITGMKAQLWGDRLIGFGSYHYRYPSGREGRWFYTGFSARKNKLSISINSGLQNHSAQLQKLGKFKMGTACLYVSQLSDVHIPTLRELIHSSYSEMKSKYEDD